MKKYKDRGELDSGSLILFSVITLVVSMSAFGIMRSEDKLNQILTNQEIIKGQNDDILAMDETTTTVTTTDAIKLTKCEALESERAYLDSHNVPDGLVVAGGDCAAEQDTSSWVHNVYPGIPDDQWTYQLPKDVVYDADGFAKVPLLVSDLPSGQHPFYADALTLKDLVPGTLLCRMVGDTTLGSYVVTDFGVELQSGQTDPYFFWEVAAEYTQDLQYDGVIPYFDGTWSPYHLRAGTCDQSS